MKKRTNQNPIQPVRINAEGFTLIEILVVVAIIGIVISVTSDAFLQIIRTSNKANIITEIKQNGDAALSQIERIVRNAKAVRAVGSKTYTAGSATWTTTSPGIDDFSCSGLAGNTSSHEICAFIVENPDGSTSRYTKVTFENEGTSASDNGVITIANSASGDDLTAMQTKAGDIITNNETVSGISLTAVDLKVKRDTIASKPSLVLISYTFSQAKDASSRADNKADVKFETVLSLRSY